MVVWGIKDNDSWRSGSNPLLYTSGLGKKPAWYAVRSALRHQVIGGAGVSPVSCDNIATDGTFYDLQGRRVNANNLRPGLYIRDGKKIFKN
jgi:hypothetical protein